MLFCYFSANGPVIFTSEKDGNDDNGDGSFQKPYKTVLHVSSSIKIIIIMMVMIIVMIIMMLMFVMIMMIMVNTMTGDDAC